jgi:WD40 repeat protein
VRLRPTLPTATPALTPVAAPPDLPDPALHRVLVGHGGSIPALAVPPHGGWLASASTDGTLRLWDPATGRGAAVLRLGDHPRHLAAPAPDLLVAGGARGPHFLRVVN